MLTYLSGFDEAKVYFCNASDTKPVEAPNGSFLFEMSADSVAVYLFDEENSTWVPFGS
jgi:hypothetical protein